MARTNDNRISDAIVAFRIAAGGPVETCPTCNRDRADPYRRLDGFRITAGCVDPSHTGYLPSRTPTAAWHDRPTARKMRAELWERLAQLAESCPAEGSEPLALAQLSITSARQRRAS